MPAYFSSKFKKQFQAAFGAILLALCLLGTHWTGLSHGISHAGFQSQTLEAGTTSNPDKGFTHSLETCHLFDALSLAGFIPSAQNDISAIHLSLLDRSNVNHVFLRSLNNSAYQSRAPPAFIL